MFQTIKSNLMRYIFALFIFLFANVIYAQNAFPDFLQGTWKVENKEIYEHWDKLNESTLKGISYQLKYGVMTISEYLDISKTKEKLTFTATVLNQNHGEGVSFKGKGTDSTITFENPDHDFPKKIVYHKLNDAEIHVQVYGGKNNDFTYTMSRQFEKKSIRDTTISNPNYDDDLAKKLGGDDYGMKSYVFVILKTGPNKTTDKTLINNSFRGHMDNIKLLVKEGKLIVAGPLGKNDQTYRGIFILNVPTIEEAKDLLKIDAAIKEGLLDYELYKWYGSAALPTYLEYSNKIWKDNP